MKVMKATFAAVFVTLVGATSGFAQACHDVDKDGLSGRFERYLGLLPHRSDSDRDGQLDGDEPVAEGVTARELQRTLMSTCDTKIEQDGVRVAAAKNCSKIKNKKKRKKCLKKQKTPGTTPTPTPTATPGGGGGGGGNPTPGPTATPTVAPTATPRPTATPTATPTPPSSSGNAAAGKSFYTATCTSCHGKKSGKSESQVRSSIASEGDHAPFRALLTNQNYKDIAAYLNSNL